MELPRTADVVVVGGGVMGASTAYHLALKGCKNVLLLERNPLFGQEATGKCAGGIRYQFATEINIRLSLLSLPLLDRFEEELGQAIDLRHCGYLFLLTREEDIKTFKANVTLQHRHGVMTEWLDGDTVRSRLPLMRLDDVLTATWNPRDGLADPNGVVQGYISGARRLGVKCLTDTEVTGIVLENGRIRGVKTRKGELGTPILVNAAGPWASQIGEMAGFEIPVVPVRRQIAVTTPIPQLPIDFPFVIDFAKNLYFHREGPAILTGMSNTDEPPGFNQQVDREWELVHFEAAMARMPLLENAGVSSRWAGLYEVSPDAHPILGRVDEVEGLYLINGFSGHGFMHGPACGLLLAEEILDGQARALDITSLRLNRFRKGQPILEYNVV
ncbi:MAG: FAD-binding oxidoreductase [Deltaproteobacteria bacterium]|nr:MAG: FAD-binding oxidoreductase [Deltaproteobacteria bacterium]